VAFFIDFDAPAGEVMGDSFYPSVARAFAKASIINKPSFGDKSNYFQNRGAFGRECGGRGRRGACCAGRDNCANVRFNYRL
jgi:hypothetical protein